MASCNQIENIVKITKHKYLWAIVPILLILFSFLLSFVFENDSTVILTQKVLSGMGLLSYIFVSLTHRIGKQNCDIEIGEIYSPINGRVKKIRKEGDSVEIILQKNIFDRCEIRGCENSSFDKNPLSEKGSYFDWEVVSGDIIFLSDSKIPKGIIAFSTGRVIVKLKGYFNEKIEVGQKIIAGKSVLGEKNEVS
ncbi:MAG: hypothetical protein U9N34_06145 [Candidatus Cloacimonadota bacterium]|nr:hypothetical protein [Candidatus Cloacimonadota bacterium]